MVEPFINLIHTALVDVDALLIFNELVFPTPFWRPTNIIYEAWLRSKSGWAIEPATVAVTPEAGCIVTVFVELPPATLSITIGRVSDG